jgi:hypothetical protein
MDKRAAVKYIIIFAIGVLAARILFSFISKTAPLTENPALINKKRPLPAVVETVVEHVQRPEKKSRPELVLNGIAASGLQGWAIINDRIVKVGDTIKGAHVVGISADRVDLEFDNETFSLSIK